MQNIDDIFEAIREAESFLYWEAHEVLSLSSRKCGCATKKNAVVKATRAVNGGYVWDAKIYDGVRVVDSYSGRARFDYVLGWACNRMHGKGKLRGRISRFFWWGDEGRPYWEAELLRAGELITYEAFEDYSQALEWVKNELKTRR